MNVKTEIFKKNDSFEKINFFYVFKVIFIFLWGPTMEILVREPAITLYALVALTHFSGFFGILILWENSGNLKL